MTPHQAIVMLYVACAAAYLMLLTVVVVAVREYRRNRHGRNT